MATKKPYKVLFTVEAIVMADSEVNAMRAGRTHLREEINNLSHIDVDAEPLVRPDGTYVLPERWELDCLVYGLIHEDVSTGAAIADEQERLGVKVKA